MKTLAWLNQHCRFAQIKNVSVLVDDIYKNVIINQFYGNQDLANEIYSFLTGGVHDAGAKYRDAAIGSSKELRQKYQTVYDQILQSLNFDQSEWTFQNTPPWGAFFREKAPKLDSKFNFKRYITLANPKSKEIKKLDKLMQALQTVPSVRGLKYPLQVDWLIHGIDNIVIYFSDKKDASAIDSAIAQSGIQQGNRKDFFRQNFGIDEYQQDTDKKHSDTQLASLQYARSFTKWLNQLIPNSTQTVLDKLKTKKELDAKNTIQQAISNLMLYKPEHHAKYK